MPGIIPRAALGIASLALGCHGTGLQPSTGVDHWLGLIRGGFVGRRQLPFSGPINGTIATSGTVRLTCWPGAGTNVGMLHRAFSRRQKDLELGHGTGGTPVHRPGKLLGMLGALIGVVASSTAFAQNSMVDPTGDSGGIDDVVRLTGWYTATTVRIRIDFAPGTLVRTNYAFTLGLDIDQNASTGILAPFYPTGADFTLAYNVANDPDNVSIGGDAHSLNLYPVIFGTDSATVEVPLREFRNDDGVMAITLLSGISWGPGPAEIKDTVPNGAAVGVPGIVTAPLPAPELTIRTVDGVTTVSWVSGSGASLVESTTVGPDAAWSPSSLPVTVVGAENRVTVPATAGARYFRLSL